jgi:maltose phosphorylase
MAKVAYEYFKVNPWKIEEEGFKPERNKVAESVFSIANEYMGVRGYMEEGVSCDSLLGSYFNGIYEYGDVDESVHYKGIVNQTHFMVNSVDWLYTRIYIDGEKLDVNKAEIKDFKRTLDFKKGDFTRTFILITKDRKEIRFTFKRFVSMNTPNYGYQRIEVEAINKAIEVEIITGLDFSILHWGKHNYWNVIKQEYHDNFAGCIGETIMTKQKVFSGYQLQTNIDLTPEPFKEKKVVGHRIKVKLAENKKIIIDKNVTNIAEKKPEKTADSLWDEGLNKLNKQESYSSQFQKNVEYWSKIWSDFDIEIEGDEKNQQGIRFCIFQLQQTYNGVDPENNIGAKGLTGEAYSGHTFWDTETYCLPFFIFNNPEAARNLLMYRYNTLEEAKKRALQLDCKGACYPIATLNGEEACTLWQHASLQFQPSTGVAYGIWHYVKNTGDIKFLYNFGLEMLIEISRFLVSRGQWNSDHTKFGYYCVMGPDEFQMMVNHNSYTNFMAKKTFEYALEVLDDLKAYNYKQYELLINKLKLQDKEVEEFKTCAEEMYIPYDEETLLYEQHEGFFDLPHVDVDSIPVEDFPLYENWSYDRLYRNDMIKQPDVLMFMFLHNQEFSRACKKANYEYYEPRCIHESSLSPSVHSILAAELDKIDEAVKFFEFATRMDIDDYNRNTSEGLHTTSIAAAWLNIVYGFGGFRSDGEDLILNPVIPDKWKGYRFKFKYRGNLITVKVTNKEVDITCDKGEINLVVYGKKYSIKTEPLKIEVKK